MARTKQTAWKSTGGKRAGCQGQLATFEAQKQPKRSRLGEVSNKKSTTAMPSKPKRLANRGATPAAAGSASSSSHSTVMPITTLTSRNSSVMPMATLKTPEKKVIWVKRGTIAQTQVDVIVNICNPDLLLDSGSVSTAILHLAGQQIQNECDLMLGRSYGQQHQKKVPIGQFRVTSAGKMPRCKAIYHAVCPDYSEANSEQILSALVYNLLVEANANNMSSIAFPAVGSGAAGFPPETIAKIICQEMIRFSQQVSTGSLFDLRLVVHWHQDEIFKAFQIELGQCSLDQANKENSKTKIKAAQPSSKAASNIQQTSSTSSEMDTITVIEDNTPQTQSQQSIITLSDSPIKSSASSSSPVFVSLLDSDSDSESDQGLNTGLLDSNTPEMSSPSSTDKLAGPSSSLLLSPGSQGEEVKFKNLTIASWGTTSMWIGSDMVVQVTKGDLAAEADVNDSIVVQTSNTFDINGNVAQTIINKGGPTIVQQCSWQRKNLTGTETILTTTGGTFKCERIIFVALEDPSLVKQRVIEALNTAENEGMRSVVLPALGTGRLQGNPMICASAMLDAIGEFMVSTNPQSVNRIKIVIYDSLLLDVYKGVFKNKEGQSYGCCKRKVTTDTVETSPSSKVMRSREEEIYCKQELSYDSELMGAMNGNKLKEVKSCATKCKVTVTPLPYGQRHIKSFELEGKRLDVLGAKSDIQQLYLKFQKQYTEKKQGHKLCENVEWKWWSQSDSKLIAYDIDVAAEIEQAYQQNKPFVDPPELAGFRIDINQMKEIKLAGILAGQETTVQRIAQQEKESRSEFPSSWAKMEPTENLKVVSISKTSNEYQTVQSAFVASVGGSGNAQRSCPCGSCHQPRNGVQVTKIERIQNKELYKQYEARKESMQTTYKGKGDIERHLYHGTAAATCDAINRRGFNRSYSKNCMYGQGSYFARDASYSAQGYAVPDHAGDHRLYMCKVLTGDYVKGNPQMRFPPNKPGKRGDIYDSLVDDKKNPSIFVIFHDTQAYPEYLITFTW